MTQPDPTLKRTLLPAAHVRAGRPRGAPAADDKRRGGARGRADPVLSRYGPSVDRYIGIGYGYVPAALAATGIGIAVEVRGRGQAARVVKTPFHPPRVKR